MILHSILFASLTSISVAAGAIEQHATPADQTVQGSAARTAASIRVWITGSGRRIELHPATLQKVSTDSNVSASKPKGAGILGHLAVAALAGVAPGLGQAAATAEGMAQAKSGSSSVALKSVWAIEGPSSELIVPSSTSTFDISMYGAADSLRDMRPVILRLATTAQSVRNVTRTELDMGMHSGGPVHATLHFSDEQVPARVTMLTSGIARLSLGAPLSPGQYAIAFRPSDAGLTLEGTTLAYAAQPNSADPQAWQLAWDFTVR